MPEKNSEPKDAMEETTFQLSNMSPNTVLNHGILIPTLEPKELANMTNHLLFTKTLIMVQLLQIPQIN